MVYIIVKSSFPSTFCLVLSLITATWELKSPTIRLNIGLLYSSVKHLCQVPSCVNECCLRALTPTFFLFLQLESHAGSGGVALVLTPCVLSPSLNNLTSRLKEMVGSYGNMSDISENEAIFLSFSFKRDAYQVDSNWSLVINKVRKFK